MRFVLASASPTRLRVLQEAGFDPEVIVSGVDEDTDGTTDPEEVALVLAERKAAAVAPQCPDAVVLGCDSVVALDGRLLAKPASEDEARSWWRAMRAAQVAVSTGHCIVAGGRVASLVDTAVVRFGDPSDEEIDRYIGSGEPMGVAGGFRLDGRAAAFIPLVQGDPGTVHGVSVFVLRHLLHELDIEVTDLWR